MSENQAINIIEDAEGELRVSSLIIAGRTENQHASVLRIIRDNLADFESFGRVGFEIAPFETGESPATRMKGWPMVADALPAVGVFHDVALTD